MMDNETGRSKGYGFISVSLNAESLGLDAKFCTCFYDMFVFCSLPMQNVLKKPWSS